ncbi:hypothetical protein LTR37_018822 [Vermiconidia calcicola]|uniref:Uncharacterized protein n=1 Tax=Vermiconidia calcicola TaxID=1690605 RepID=A0ACC3MG05_9PEZI|nr:hypothetical protein LTR37_018822 [Vermiconidia calcicola]
MANVSSYTYAERLQTFEHWTDHQATAKQLAAIGHVHFVKRDLSTIALGDHAAASKSYESDFGNFNFHRPNCTRLQVRIPLEPQALLPGLHGYRLDSLRSRFERRAPVSNAASSTERLAQTSSLFSLPTELRLQIYAMVLPTFDPVTELLPLNRDSARVITRMGYEKTGPRDTSKPNLLRTCRTIGEEGLDMLYSNTTFQFQGTHATKVMYLFLRSIGKNGRRLIKSVDLQCGNREDAISFALLASCEKLQAITIRLPRPVILFPRAPIWCIDGMSCLLSLSGLKEVTFGRCESSFNYMDDSKPDSAIIRRELTRAKGTAGDIRSVNGYLDI